MKHFITVSLVGFLLAAVATPLIGEGEKIEVVSQEGFTLIVRRIEAASAPEANR